MILERAKNAKRNALFGIIYRIVIVLLPFIVRTIIIKELGIEYVGISGLFSSILSILSLSELGFDSAVVIIMYRAIADDNKPQINALLAFIKKVYFIVGGTILALGLICTPFLPYLISDISQVPQDINVYYVYFVFLIAASVSYFFGGYRHSLVVAFQRDDLISKISICTQLFIFALQVFVLFTYRNYYYYAFTLPLLQLANNVLIAEVSKRLFPDIRSEGKIEKEDIVQIKKLVIGSFISMVGNRLTISLDSIIISSLLGVVLLGYYSNYYYIANSVILILYILYTSMQGGLGNAVNTDSVEKNRQDMYRLHFIYNWVVGWLCYALFFLFQPFMKLWLGKSGMLPDFVPYLLCVFIYQSECFSLVGTYKTALGIVWEDRYRPLVAGGFNLLIKLLMVLYLRRFGEEYALIGIVVSTILSYALINCPWYVSLVFKKYYKTGLKDIYIATYKYFLVAIVCCAISMPVFKFLPISDGVEGWMYMGVRCILCVIIPNLLFLLIYHKTEIFRESKSFLLARINR